MSTRPPTNNPTLSAALRAQARVLDALADEAEAREAERAQADPLLTDAQVAAELACDRSHVSRLRRSGALRAVPIGRRGRRTRRSDLDRFKAVQLRRSA